LDCKDTEYLLDTA